MTQENIQAKREKGGPGEPQSEASSTFTLQSIRSSIAALSPSDRMIALLRAIGVVVLAAIPVFLIAYRGAPDPAIGTSDPNVEPIAWPGGRIIWTLVIALLPLFIVSIGFYTWRRICPLAFFGRMSEWVQWPDKRATPNAGLRRKRVSKWVSSNYPMITSGFLVFMLALRILLINSNAVALALTFAGLCLLAALCSFRYTGKSWCNFFCPVGTIERIYTDTDRPEYRQNAQCAKCTGCKTVPSGGLCPDINQENDYWQEIRNRSRAWAFYSWPGFVLGFYLWYYLHKPYYWHAPGHMPDPAVATLLPALTGTDWGYYLSGDWTRQPSPWREWLAPGFGFRGLPEPIAQIPTLVAAPLTLLVLGLLSFLLFAGAERLWRRRSVRTGLDLERSIETTRHSLFVVAGFSGFVLFYQFAGAPTLCHLPFGLYGGFRFGVAMLATTALVTRLRRSRARQLQYDQARKWLQRWPLPDVAPPDDLEEAYRLVTEHLRTSEDRMQLYQNTIRGMLADNLITATEIGLLDRMAEDLGMGEADKKKVVRQLSSQYPGLFTGTLDDSLRLLGYRGELERSISDNRGLLPDARALRAMQSRYRIQLDEHEAVLRELRDPHSARTEHLRKTVEEYLALRADIALLRADPSPAVRFLVHELTARLADEREHILEIANLYGAAGELTGLSAAVRQGDPASTARAADWILCHLPDTVATTVADAIAAPEADPALADATRLTMVLLRWSKEGDEILRAAAVYGLRLGHAANPDTRRSAEERARENLESPEPLLREAAVAALAPGLSSSQWRAALTDPSVSVRRSAIQRVAVPVDPELRPIVRAAREDADPVVAARAGQLIDDPNAADAARGREETLTVLEKMFALRSLRLLSQIASDALRQLAENAEEHVFQANDLLCVEGEASDDVYLILDGQTEAVRTVGGAEVRLGLNRPGETVGEMGILDPAPRMATVRALTPNVRVLTVHGADFRALLARDTSASIGIIRLLIQRQRGMAK